MGVLRFRLLNLLSSARARFDPVNLPPGRFLGFEETLAHLSATGESFVRFGDGEFIVLHGGGIYYQQADPELSRALDGIIRGYRPGCGYLLGLPIRMLTTPNARIRARDREQGVPGKSSVFYLVKDTFRRRFPTDMPYGHSRTFRGHPERAGEIAAALWQGTPTLFLVTSDPANADLVRELCPDSTVIPVPIPAANAFARRSEILEACLAAARTCPTPRRFLLSAGPAAKPLVCQLAAAGETAYDVGHLFMAIRRMRAA